MQPVTEYEDGETLEMRKGKHRFTYILSVAILAGIALFCIFHIVDYFSQLYMAERNAEQLQDMAVITVENNSGNVLNDIENPQGDTGEAEKDIPAAIDFTALQKISGDAVAWIYVPDTCISYVVAQGGDDSYYLDHMLNGKYSTSGTIFMDSRNTPDFTDWNTILYGHHMKNGTMFAALENYKEQEYYENHPVIYLYTPQYRYRLEVAAAALVEPDDAIYTISGTEEDKEEILRNLQEKSYIKTKAKTEGDNRIVTLSTCAYDFEDARFVVVGNITDTAACSISGSR